jgi:SAM-dependent methyltransferase
VSSSSLRQAWDRSAGASSWRARIRQDYEANGLRHVVRHVGHKLASPLLRWGRLEFYVRDLADPLPEPSPRQPLELRQASPHELAQLVLDGKPTPLEALAERFRRGHLCFVAVDADGRIAHSRWVARDRAHVLELACDVVLRPGEAYMYDGYTRPDARGTGVDGAMRLFIFGAMRRAGCRSVCSYANADNPVSLRAARRLQRQAGSVRYLGVAGLRPLVRVAGRERIPKLVPSQPAEQEAERSRRAAALRGWFRSWLGQPLARRSIGYAELPEASFASTAQYVVETLGLDAASHDVLDVGCDSSLVTRLVAPHCRSLVGVDFIPEMLADARRAGLAPAGTALVAADGRQLPFRPDAFGRVYCNGVIHTLPSRSDGLAVVLELLRVCAPGGRVLVGCVPDRRKRWVRRLDLWQESGFPARLRILGSLALPAPAKRALRRLAGSRLASEPPFLDYDLEELRGELSARGARAEIIGFPEGFWSRDFRRTRSSLVFTKPRP